MSTRRKPTPSYLEHKQSGRARVVWYDAAGTRRQKLLPGPFDSSESRTAFAQFQLELEAAPHHTHASEPEGIILAELLLAFLDHAEKHYRLPDGTPSSEIFEVKIVVRALRELYADLPVAQFTPLRLKAARQRWVNEGRSRTEWNRRTGLVKRILKWGVSEGLVPVATYQAVATVTALAKGRTAARETEPVGPVDDEVVDATLPFLNRHVRGLVEFQRLTGCRPGEACAIRRRDIDTGGAIWLYKPGHHKNAWRGKARTIAVGPRAQALLKEYFTPDITGYLFSPRRAVEELNAERSARRKTPRYPSHLKRNAERRTTGPKRLAEKYGRGSYGLAIDRACDRAFPPPGLLAKSEGETHAQWQARLTPGQKQELAAWRKAHTWRPNQLRHAHATRVRKQFGLEAAGATLGHARMNATEIYAQRDASLAMMVATKLG